MILGSWAEKNKTKDMNLIIMWISMQFLLFYTPQPNSPVWILIIQNWPATMGLWLYTVLGSFSSRNKSEKPIDQKQIQFKKTDYNTGKERNSRVYYPNRVKLRLISP